MELSFAKKVSATKFGFRANRSACKMAVSLEHCTIQFQLEIITFSVEEEVSK